MAHDHGYLPLAWRAYDASKVCGDTWEWDGNKWTQVSQAGPHPRTLPAMAYDELPKRIVLSGGNRVLFGRTPEENKFLEKAPLVCYFTRAVVMREVSMVH